MRQGIPGRRAAFRDPRPVFLVVCEGTSTEPSYFDACQTVLKCRVMLKVDSTSGSAPISVVDYALKRRRDNEKEVRRKAAARFDRVAVVFDHERDGMCESFDRARDKAKANGLMVGISNPSIEVWFVLHYEYTTKPYADCDDVIRTLKKHIPDYTKGKKDLTSMVEATELACKNARKLRAYFVDEADLPNPYTNLDELVSEMIETPR